MDEGYAAVAPGSGLVVDELRLCRGQRGEVSRQVVAHQADMVHTFAPFREEAGDTPGRVDGLHELDARCRPVPGGQEAEAHALLRKVEGARSGRQPNRRS